MSKITKMTCFYHLCHSRHLRQNCGQMMKTLNKNDKIGPLCLLLKLQIIFYEMRIKKYQNIMSQNEKIMIFNYLRHVYATTCATYANDGNLKFWGSGKSVPRIVHTKFGINIFSTLAVAWFCHIFTPHLRHFMPTRAFLE